MRYKPWVLTLNVHLQGFFFVLLEVYYSHFRKYEYSREILELNDGGEIALDWLIHPTDNQTDITTEGPTDSPTYKSTDNLNDNSKRHIIVLFPGVNGDSTKLYAVSMQQASVDNNFDLVVVNWRGMGGVPLKSAKTYNGYDTSHIEEAVDYIYNEYCLDDKGN